MGPQHYYFFFGDEPDFLFAAWVRTDPASFLAVSVEVFCFSTLPARLASSLDDFSLEAIGFPLLAMSPRGNPRTRWPPARAQRAAFGSCFPRAGRWLWGRSGHEVSRGRSCLRCKDTPMLQRSSPRFFDGDRWRDGRPAGRTPDVCHKNAWGYLMSPAGRLPPVAPSVPAHGRGQGHRSLPNFVPPLATFPCQGCKVIRLNHLKSRHYPRSSM